MQGHQITIVCINYSFKNLLIEKSIEKSGSTDHCLFYATIRTVLTV
jgi:hypothetical protein